MTIDPTEPARQFAKRVQEEYERFAEESDQLDRAFLSGRVGQLIKKWQSKFKQPEESDDTGTDDAEQADTNELEGGPGGQTLETETG